MAKGKLAFSDKSELAAAIRKALGADPFEEINVSTPQFERTDGRTVVLRPRTAEQLDKIKKLPDDVLWRIGIGVWAGGPWGKLYLFPGEWYECIPDGYLIRSIFGETETFKRGRTDNDIRFGFLPYGWLDHTRPGKCPGKDECELPQDVTCTGECPEA